MGATLGCQCGTILVVVWSCPLGKNHLLSVRDICSIPYPHLGTGVYSCRTPPSSPGTCVWVKTVPSKLITYNPTLYQPQIIASLMKYYPCLEQLNVFASSVVEATFGPHCVPAYFLQTPYRAQKNYPFRRWHQHLTTVLAHSQAIQMSEMEFTLTKLWTKFSPSSTSPC